MENLEDGDVSFLKKEAPDAPTTAINQDFLDKSNMQHHPEVLLLVVELFFTRNIFMKMIFGRRILKKELFIIYKGPRVGHSRPQQQYDN